MVFYLSWDDLVWLGQRGLSSGHLAVMLFCLQIPSETVVRRSFAAVRKWVWMWMWELVFIASRLWEKEKQQQQQQWRSVVCLVPSSRKITGAEVCCEEGKEVGG